MPWRNFYTSALEFVGPGFITMFDGDFRRVCMSYLNGDTDGYQRNSLGRKSSPLLCNGTDGEVITFSGRNLLSFSGLLNGLRIGRSGGCWREGTWEGGQEGTESETIREHCLG